MGITYQHVIERSATRVLTIRTPDERSGLADSDELNLYLGTKPAETAVICDQLIERLVAIRGEALKAAATQADDAGMTATAQAVRDMADKVQIGDRVQVRGRGPIGRVIARSWRFPELITVQWPDQTLPGVHAEDELTAYAEEDVPSGDLPRSADLAAGDHFAGMTPTIDPVDGGRNDR
jgi:hypothetical protein